MRNLVAYPITNKDRVEVLKRLREDHAATDIMVGDLTGVVLDDIIAIFEGRKTPDENIIDTETK